MGNKTAKYIWAVLNFVAVVWLALGGVGGRAFGQTLIGKTVRLNDGTDNVYSVFGEQDIKERVNVKNYADGNTSDSLVWSGVGTDFYLRKNRRGNLITVAKSGGDYDTIQAAVDAATTGTTVLVYPGTYEEQVSIEKSDISIVGVDRKRCIISRASSGSGGDVMVVKIGFNDSENLSGIVLANLTIKNTAAWGAGPAQEALSVGVKSGSGTHTTEVKVYNCDLYGYQDTVFAYPKSTLTLQGCLIDGGFDILSVWKANVKAYDCDFYQHHTKAAGSIYLTDTTGTYLTIIDGCRFYATLTGSGALHVQDNNPVSYFTNNFMDANHTATAVYHESGVVNTTTYVGGNFGVNAVYSSQCVALNTGKINADHIVANISVNAGSIGGDGSSNIQGKSIILTDASPATTRMRYQSSHLEFTGNGYEWNTNLYWGGANILKTDDAFDANSLKIGGTEVISSARALSNVSIGGGLIDSGTVADARLSSNVPLKNGANTFTNFQTISANATSDMLTVSGGNMSDGKSALRVSGAFPNSAGAYNSMADFKATSGGSDKNEYALNSELLAGGTSAVISAAGRFINARSGTGGAFGTVSGAVGNLGVYAQSGATTAGYNYGGIFDARGGAVNVGVEGLAITNKASAVNVGVFGNASNTAEGGVQVGGLFGLNRTTPPASSAALICDNGNTGKDVFLAKVNGANKVKIDLNGNVELEDGINVKGEIKQNGVVAIRMDGCRYFTMPDANKKANGDIISLNDFTHNFGELVYLASDGKAYKADASSTATLPAVAMVADDSAQGYFLLRGYIRNDDWDTLTIGKEVWASTTAGGITQVKPTGAGESVQSVGFAVGAKTIFFDPQRVIITLGGEE